MQQASLCEFEVQGTVDKTMNKHLNLKIRCSYVPGYLIVTTVVAQSYVEEQMQQQFWL